MRKALTQIGLMTDLLSARWLAEEGLYADLPEGYKEMKDFTGNPYYYNETTKTASWEHPLDDVYRWGRGCLSHM